MKNALLLLLLFLPSFGGFDPPLSPQGRSAMELQLAALWPGQAPQLQAVELSPPVVAELPLALGAQSLCRVREAGQTLGFLCVWKSMGRYEPFTFMAVFEPDGLTLRRAKILEYTSPYGHEVANPRWLRQFEGRADLDACRYGQDVEAISGASISGPALAEDLGRLQRSLKMLRAQGLI